jgi:hypothetical protein
MGRAKRKQKPRAAAIRRVDRSAPPRRVDRSAALDDRAVEAILDVLHDYGGGDPIVGIRNAVIAGLVLWAIVGAVAFLLV